MSPILLVNIVLAFGLIIPFVYYGALHMMSKHVDVRKGKPFTDQCTLLDGLALTAAAAVFAPDENRCLLIWAIGLSGITAIALVRAGTSVWVKCSPSLTSLWNRIRPARGDNDSEQ